MYEAFVEWIMSLPADRIIGLITTAGVAGYTAWLALWYSCKATYHAGAFVRRKLTPTPPPPPAPPEPLTEDVQFLVDELQAGGQRRDSGIIFITTSTGNTSVTLTGEVYLNKTANMSGKEITARYSANELKAIREAAHERRKHFNRIDHDADRYEAVGQPVPVIAPCPAGKLLCSCGLSQCSVCLGRKAKAS